MEVMKEKITKAQEDDVAVLDEKITEARDKEV